MQTIKIYWNFTDKKWNLVEIGTIIPEGKYVKSYVVPAEAHFIDPTKSRLVRFAWKLHNILKKLDLKFKYITYENKCSNDKKNGKF